MSVNIYEGWAVVEMMGHRKFAGKLSPVEGFGGLLALEIPGVNQPLIVGAGSIFQITPVSEDFAKAQAEQYLNVSAWQATHLKQLLPEPPVVLLPGDLDLEAGDMEEYPDDPLNPASDYDGPQPMWSDDDHLYDHDLED